MPCSRVAETRGGGKLWDIELWDIDQTRIPVKTNPGFDTHEILVGNDYSYRVIGNEREDVRTRTHDWSRSSNEYSTTQQRSTFPAFGDICCVRPTDGLPRLD